MLGNIQWQKTLGGDTSDYLNAIIVSSDGGYVLMGASRSDISGNKTADAVGSADYWVVKLDPTGNIMWQKTIGGGGYDWGNSIEQTNDGGFILAGFSSSNASGNKSEENVGSHDYWAVKLAACSSPIQLGPFLGNDTSFCSSSSLLLDAGAGFSNYSWQDGSTQQTYLANATGSYWVQVTTQDGFTDTDTLIIWDVLSQGPTIDAGGISSLCPGKTATLDAGNGYFKYNWQDGWNESTYTIHLPGNYTVTVSDPCGNSLSDDIQIQPDYSFQFSLGKDTAWCDEDIVLTAPSGYDHYVWKDGSTSETYTVITPGAYWVVVNDVGGCQAADTIEISYCTGLNNLHDVLQVHLYPNPFQDQLVLQFNESGSSARYFELYNVLGVQQYKKELDGSLSYTMEDIHVSSGLYIYQIKDKEGYIMTGGRIIQF